MSILSSPVPAAACRLQHLLTPGRAGALSRWELQGLPALLSLLREWLGAGGGGARPRGKVPGGAGVASEQPGLSVCEVVV